jgi:protein O-GlcNAc transferase
MLWLALVIPCVLALPSVEKLLLEGVRKQQDGLQEEAKRLYNQVLAVEPEQPDALHLLGLLSFDSGAPEHGVGLIRRAIDHDEKVRKDLLLLHM